MSKLELWFERGLSSVIVLLALCAGAFGMSGGRINLSPSVDGLLFRALRPQAVEVGDLVTFCLPFSIKTFPEMGRASVRLCARDQAGQPLLKRVIRIEPNGALWVEGEREGSLDSRIFGVIPQAAVIERVRRIW